MVMDVGLWAAVAAVIVDSIVTILVGRALIRTAHRETEQAAANVAPAIGTLLTEQVVSLLPTLTGLVKAEIEHLTPKPPPPGGPTRKELPG